MTLAARVPTSPWVGRTMSLAEFLALPEQEPALELLEGVVHQKVSPKVAHGRLQSKFCERLNRVAEERGLGIAFTETRFKFGDSAPVPDVALYLWDRLPFRPDGTLPDDFDIPPDLAVEILSPEQRLSELIEKCAGLVENGVRVVLLFHPKQRSVRVLRTGAPVQVLQDEDRIELDDLIAGFELTVAELFNFLTPRRPTRGQGPAE